MITSAEEYRKDGNFYKKKLLVHIIKFKEDAREDFRSNFGMQEGGNVGGGGSSSAASGSASVGALTNPNQIVASTLTG